MTPDFARQRKKSNKKPNNWYDVEYDKILIEQSIAKQYGVLPSKQGDLRYADWAKMVGGLMDDTPLLRVVEIRRETDRDVIRRMTPDQLRLRSEWRAYQASQQAADTRDAAERQRQLQAVIAAMFG